MAYKKKEESELINLTLASSKDSDKSKDADNIINRSCFYKIFLNAEIFCSSYKIIRISIIIIFISIVIFTVASFFCSQKTALTILLNIIPLILLAIPLNLLLFNKPLLQFNLYIVDAGVDLTHVPMPDKKASSPHGACGMRGFSTFHTGYVDIIADFVRGDF